MAEATFGRYETHTVQRPISAPLAASEVQSQQVNPFETKRKNAPQGARFEILYWVVAEGTGLGANVLWPKIVSNTVEFCEELTHFSEPP